MFKPKSLVSEYTLIYSGDPALDLPTDEAQRDAVLKSARETGKYPIKSGEHATVFRVRPIPGTSYSWFTAEVRRKDLSGLEMFELAFRLALKSIDNFGDVKVKRIKVDGHELATREVLDALYTLGDVGRSIVAELGAIVTEHAADGISPLA